MHTADLHKWHRPGDPSISIKPTGRRRSRKFSFRRRDGINPAATSIAAGFCSTIDQPCHTQTRGRDPFSQRRDRYFNCDRVINEAAVVRRAKRVQPRRSSLRRSLESNYISIVHDTARRRSSAKEHESPPMFRPNRYAAFASQEAVECCRWGFIFGSIRSRGISSLSIAGG